MAEESDGIHEMFHGAGRVALTVAGLMAERSARARQQAHHDAQAASEQQGRAAAARLEGERAVARASLAPVASDDWWRTASVDDIARKWETANTWKDIDPEAQRATDRMRAELRSRYGLDVDNLAADPAAVREALERRDRERGNANGERQTAGLDEGEAAQLVLAAERADRHEQPREAAVTEEQGAEIYDSAQRRRDLAASLEGVADAETIEAVVLADTQQATPAHEAVASAPRRAPAARRSRGSTTPVRGPRRTDRGR